ncbi:hypothetical protein [Persicitalea jodogahamensis]|nr:hypothetical protein [Persicitalea jodogahamensis]
MSAIQLRTLNSVYIADCPITFNTQPSGREHAQSVATEHYKGRMLRFN